MQKTIYFLLFSLVLATASLAQKYEAENAILAGGASQVSSGDVSGGYYVAQNDGTLTFNLTLTEGAYFNIYLQVASPYGIKSNNLVVDGNIVSFNTALNSSYIHLKVVNVLKLSAGAHILQITKSWGWINIDYLELEKVDPASRFNINKALITPNPTDEVMKLYQFLYDNYCKKIISGVMDMPDAEWLKTNTGKYPALVGLDFMQTGRGYTWYNDDTPFLQAKAWYDKNGIPALCWHWRDPSHKTEAFYTADTPFDISKIFDETSAEYKAMIKDIDYTASLLKKFQDNHVPIIWRPLHEAAGGWFWWGAKGAAPCKKLWQVMYDRMVNYHGLHNMIWVWTREPNDDAWYPGDAYVDIVGRDIYQTGNHSSQLTEFNDMSSRYGGKKMVTISECGSMPDADNLVKDGAGWSYMMPWYGDFVRSSTYNSLDLWKKQFASDYVLTLDEMPNLKTYNAPIFSPAGPYCAGTTIPDLPTTSINGISGTWSPALNNQATTVYTFTPAADQIATLGKMTITITPQVTPTFETVGAYCVGSTIEALPITSTNGITGTWSPALNNQVTTEYTFTPNAGQCATTATMTIAVGTNFTPEFDFDSMGHYCVGSKIAALPTTSLNGISGTWSPAMNNMTTTEYTFTPTMECANTNSLIIYIDEKVTPTFAVVAPICSGTTIAPLPSTSLNGIVGTWSPALNNKVTTNYLFTPTSGQCATTARMTITIEPPVIPTFTVVEPYLYGETVAELPTTSLNNITGTWSPAIDNRNTTTYTFTPDANQCAVSTSLTIAIEIRDAINSIENESLKVFPTFFDNEFTIQFDKTIKTIAIYNQHGVKIKTLHPKTTHTAISMAGLPSGTYLVKVDQQSTVKIIKR
ncbi:MAG TPA: hypothetical protein DCL77_00010 [Prolixibacteraceae bacterium]|nr:hypothetical protein [Prolixibacteraceae bacterium]